MNLNENIPVFNRFVVLDSLSEDSSSLESLSTNSKNVQLSRNEDLEDKKGQSDSESSEEAFDEKKPNFPNTEEKYSHLKPEEKKFIEQYEQILKETIAKAVTEIETNKN